MVLKIGHSDQVTFLLNVSFCYLNAKIQFPWLGVRMICYLVPAPSPAPFTTHLRSCHSEFSTIPGNVRPFYMMLPLLIASFPQHYLKLLFIFKPQFNCNFSVLHTFLLYWSWALTHLWFQNYQPVRKCDFHKVINIGRLNPVIIKILDSTPLLLHRTHFPIKSHTET